MGFLNNSGSCKRKISNYCKKTYQTMLVENLTNDFAQIPRCFRLIVEGANQRGRLEKIQKINIRGRMLFGTPEFTEMRINCFVRPQELLKLMRK